MKTIVCALALALGLCAQGFTTTTQISELGPWSFCENPLTSSAPFCGGFVPGHEKYLLLIVASPGSGTAAYGYSVTATLASTGASVTLTQAVLREFTGTGGNYTPVELDFGGIVGPIQVIVTDFAAVGIITSEHRVSRR